MEIERAAPYAHNSYSRAYHATAIKIDVVNWRCWPYAVHFGHRGVFEGREDDFEVALEGGTDREGDVAKHREDLRLHRPVYLRVLQTEQRTSHASPTGVPPCSTNRTENISRFTDRPVIDHRLVSANDQALVELSIINRNKFIIFFLFCLNLNLKSKIISTNVTMSGIQNDVDIL